jgi:uncharacterized protein (DUF1810 family)
MTDRDLTRFVDAQSGGEYESALAEIHAGRKRSHWIWYVFPQIAGLGSSAMTNYFGVQGRGEAEAYLHDDTLRSRLRQAIDVVAGHVGGDSPVSLDELMGSEVDARKLVSSLTLFEAVAGDFARREAHGDVAHVADQARAILEFAAREGYERCRFTLEQLARDAPDSPNP